MNKKLIAVILGAIAGLFLAAVTHASTLSWTDNSDNENGFNIYRAAGIGQNFTLVGTVAPNITTFVDANGAPGNCWRITAFNTAGESAPSNDACLLLVVPTSPGILSVTP